MTAGLRLGSEVVKNYRELLMENIMNSFKQKIKAAENEIQILQSNMMCFSAALMERMGLTENDVRAARGHDVEWRIGNYNITPRCFPWCGWRTILIATPATIGGDMVGYSNAGENNNLPANWTIVEKGTASIILPDSETQKDILRTIREQK